MRLSPADLKKEIGECPDKDCPRRGFYFSLHISLVYFPTMYSEICVLYTNCIALCVYIVDTEMEFDAQEEGEEEDEEGIK